MSNRIVEEAEERIAGDVALGQRIDIETAERQAEDTALSNRIVEEAEERIANDIASGAINSESGAITLKKNNGDVITLSGEICDSRLDAVSYDADTGKMTFTMKDHYNNDQEKSIVVSDIASKSALDKEIIDRIEADEIEKQERIAGDNMMNSKLNQLGSKVNKVGAGAAALAALHPMDFDPDDKLSFAVGAGNYAGETATALGAFYRPSEKVMISAAGTMGNGENMVNMGVTFALDKTNNVSNSRTAMAREIQDLRQQVAALTMLVMQMASRDNAALAGVAMFPDVPENHWAYDYIEGLQKQGIIEGYPDGNFGGDRSMTRYEFAAMLYRALEKGFPVDSRLLNEFNAELGRIRVDRIKGADDDANKIERVRVNNYEDRDDYGSKIIQVKAGA